MNTSVFLGLVYALCVSAEGATSCAASAGPDARGEPLSSGSISAHPPSLALLQHGLRLHWSKAQDLQHFVSEAMAEELTDGLLSRNGSIFGPAKEDGAKGRSVYTALTDVADRLAANAVMVNLF